MTRRPWGCRSSFQKESTRCGSRPPGVVTSACPRKHRPHRPAVRRRSGSARRPAAPSTCRSTRRVRAASRRTPSRKASRSPGSSGTATSAAATPASSTFPWSTGCRCRLRPRTPTGCTKPADRHRVRRAAGGLRRPQRPSPCASRRIPPMASVPTSNSCTATPAATPPVGDAQWTPSFLPGTVLRGRTAPAATTTQGGAREEVGCGSAARNRGTSWASWRATNPEISGSLGWFGTRINGCADGPERP